MFLRGFIAFSVLLVAVLLGGGYYFVSNSNRLAQDFIEKSGSEALGVPLTVGALDISFSDRKATIKNLEIANPEGFEEPFAVRFKDISVTLGEISSDLAVIKDVSISGADVHYVAQNGGSNLTLIKDQVEKRNAAQPSAEPSKLPKLVLDRFSLREATIYPEMKLIAGQGFDTTVSLSDVALEGIGRSENGVPSKVVTDAILDTLNGRVRTAVARAGFFEGLTNVALMSVTGGIPIIGISDEILGLIDPDDEDKKTSTSVYGNGERRFND